MNAHRVVLTTLLAFMAGPLIAGFTYRIQLRSDATRSGEVVARAFVEGTASRVEFERGDGILFHDGNVAISLDAGRTVRVFDPAAKTYYELAVERQSGDALSMLRQLGGEVKVSNTRVDVRDLGPAVPLAGLPTRRYQVTASCDVHAVALSQTIQVHLTIARDLWKTDRLGTAASSFLQSEHTGIAAVDQLLGARSGALKGFTLKEISKVDVVAGGSRVVSSTTTFTISEVAPRAIAPSTFQLPSGVRRIASPLDNVIGSLPK